MSGTSTERHSLALKFMTGTNASDSVKFMTGTFIKVRTESN